MLVRSTLTIEFSDNVIHDIETAMRDNYKSNQLPYSVLRMNPTTADEFDKHVGYLKPTGDPARWETLSYRWGVVQVDRDPETPEGTILLT